MAGQRRVDCLARLALLQIIGKMFTHAEVRKFDYEDNDAAEKWLMA